MSVNTGFRASDFINSIGVNVKNSMSYDAYSNSSLTIKSLNYLGVDKVRDALLQYGKSAPIIDALANSGIEFNFRVSSSLPAKGEAGVIDYITDLKNFLAEHPSSIVSIEGLNEANAFYFKFNDDSSIAGAAAFQKYLYETINSDSILRNLPVYNFTIAYNTQENYDQIGNLGAYSDAANIHLYLPTGAGADLRMEYAMNLARGASRGDPIVITEIGHTTHYTEPSVGTSPKGQAKMMLSELLLAYENGAKEMYIYELFDNSASQARGEKEGHFGLFTETGTPKIAATALHNLTTILKSGDNGSSDGILPTTFSVQSGASTVHAMSFEKSGGVYNIAVWNDRSVWNDALNVDYVNPIINTAINLGRIESIVRVYDPMVGLTPIATYQNTRIINLPLRDSPLIIEVGAARALEEIRIITAPNLTMTSAELVSQIDTLVLAEGLQKITLTDTKTLSVSSFETMNYMIKNYASTLNKITNGYSFETSYGEASWTKVHNYNSNGKLSLTTEYNLNNFEVISKSMLRPDGAREYYRYEIENKSYVTEHQSYDITGRLDLLERFHANGSYNLRDVRNADGSRLYETYNSIGQKTSAMLTGADGGTAERKYAAGVILSEVVREADGDVLTITYSAGVQTRLTVVSHEGWRELTNYNATTGKIIDDLRTEVDGARVYSAYDAFGKLASVTSTAADGNKSHMAYLQDGTGDVRTDSYDALGQGLMRQVAHSNGTYDVYAYANNQTLEGGEKNDVFYFRTTAGGKVIYEGGADTVHNFNTGATGIERLVIDDEWATGFGDMSLTQQGVDVLIRFDSLNSILVKQQTVGNLVSDHFLFT